MDVGTILGVFVDSLRHFVLVRGWKGGGGNSGIKE